MDKTTYDKILKIAREVRSSLLDSDESSTGMCGFCSRELVKVLVQSGFNAIVQGGTIDLDDPMTDDEGVDVYDPLHYWVEIDGYVIDLTADQFNDFVDEKFHNIVFDAFEELGRYTRVAKYTPLKNF